MSTIPQLHGLIENFYEKKKKKKKNIPDCHPSSPSEWIDDPHRFRIDGKLGIVFDAIYQLLARIHRLLFRYCVVRCQSRRHSVVHNNSSSAGSISSDEECERKRRFVFLSHTRDELPCIRPT